MWVEKGVMRMTDVLLIILIILVLLCLLSNSTSCEWGSDVMELKRKVKELDEEIISMRQDMW